jgi:hypothetical protein
MTYIFPLEKYLLKKDMTKGGMGDKSPCNTKFNLIFGATL